MARDALCVLNIMASKRMKCFTLPDVIRYRFLVPANIRDALSLNCGPRHRKAPWRRLQISSEVSATSERQNPIQLSEPLYTPADEDFFFFDRRV